ncbi:hypothetical protein SO802_025619 [Lithocarpus litseifolius]|uniref:Spindle and kinetochore-associated protein 3 n=1 Tax=Lithocarpus litseifolius TaxID=425828 RepID=A0AAW2C0X3_9ROSI
MTFGTVSFEELLGHCTEVYKKNQSDLAELELRLKDFEYNPELLGHCNEVYKKNQSDLAELELRLKDFEYNPEVEVDDEDEVHSVSTPHGLEMKVSDLKDVLDSLYSYCKPDSMTSSIVKSLEEDALYPFVLILISRFVANKG